MCFGIDPITSELKGINNKFENLDNRYFSTGVIEGLDGSIEFEFFTHYFETVLIGFLIIKETKCKPIILKTNFENSGEKGIAGDIYFRYPARTGRISYSDLRNLINSEISNLSKKLFNQVEYILSNGPENTAILNTIDGDIKTENGINKLILSKDILNELNLIQEGNIVQKDGAPAYIIKGAIHVEDTKFIEKHVAKALHASEIFKALFSETCEEPITYLRELLFKDTPYYPLFFFIRKAKISNEDAIQLLMDELDTDIKKTQRKKLIDRINLKTDFIKQGKVITPFNVHKIDVDIKIETLIDELTQKYKVTGTKSSLAVARKHCILLLKASN